MPKKAAKGGYVYVLGFDNGLVKVGQTCDPKRRIQRHSAMASLFECELVDGWVSRLQARPDAVESAVLRDVGRHAVVGEWLRGAEYADVVRIAQGLQGPELSLAPVTQRSILDTRWVESARSIDGARRAWIVLWSLIPRLEERQIPRVDIDIVEFARHACMRRRAAREALFVLRSSGGIAVVENTYRDLSITMTPPGVALEDVCAAHQPFALPVAARMQALYEAIPRRRPGATFTSAVGMLAWASVAVSGPIGVVPMSPVRLTVPLAAVAESTGTARSTAWRDRLRVLRGVGLIRPVGETWRQGIIVVPIGAPKNPNRTSL